MTPFPCGRIALCQTERLTFFLQEDSETATNTNAASSYEEGPLPREVEVWAWIESNRDKFEFPVRHAAHLARRYAASAYVAPGAGGRFGLAAGLGRCSPQHPACGEVTICFTPTYVQCLGESISSV